MNTITEYLSQITEKYIRFKRNVIPLYSVRTCFFIFYFTMLECSTDIVWQCNGNFLMMKTVAPFFQLFCDRESSSKLLEEGGCGNLTMHAKHLITFTTFLENKRTSSL